METPIYDTMRRYAKNRMRFHVPGHKGRVSLFPSAARYDITELDFSDDLGRPTGAIRRAQRLFAEAYGADEAYFVTTGATTGVLAACLALAGRKMLVDRYSHASLYNGLALFGVEPVFVNDRVREDFPVLQAAEVAAAFDAAPDAAGLFLTYPNYYGRAADIAAISAVCRARGKILVTDASHGSHFAFSPRLPASPVPYSDVTVLSQHKTGLAFTGGAAVAVNGTAVDAGGALRKLHSTSPSYLVLASIDFSRAYMVQYYRNRIEELIGALEKLRRRLLATPLVLCPSDDALRLTVDVSALGMTGWEAERLLNRAGAYPEFGDGRRLVFVLSGADRPRDVKRLCGALVALARLKGDSPAAPAFDFAPKRVVPYQTALSAERERVRTAQAAGRVSAGNAGLYPPGVPLVLAGEEITAETAKLLASGHAFGAGEEIEVLK